MGNAKDTQGRYRVRTTAAVLVICAWLCMASAACSTTYPSRERVPDQKREELREALTQVLEQLDLYGMPAAWERKPEDTLVVGRHAGYERNVYRCTVSCKVQGLGDSILFEVEPHDGKVYSV